MQRKWMIGGVAVVVVAGGAWWAFRPKDTGPKWRQAKIDKGNITQKVNATGSVGPLVQVAVGTQVSGVVSALYVDYNSIVKKGQLIAEIDPTLMETQLQDAQASVNRAKDTLENARRQYDRAKRLAEAKLLSDQDLDTQLIALQTASANYDSAKATLARAQANLGYCRITAPVDGVVISRLADVGQTVAASFSTPNLFQIAKDLSQMKVQVSIGESDIDAVMVGQKAFFNVDSLPDKQFAATVSLVRQEPVTTQNVVNYVVEMIVPNEPLGGEGGGEVPAAGGEPRMHGRFGGPEGGPADPEKAWERMKDRLPEGMTKEAFMKRFQERMKQMKAAQGPATQAKGAPMSEASLRDLARIPGGSTLLPGPRFKGDFALRPGMTANVTIVTNQKRDVLRVPNAALRFNPAAFIKDETKKGDGGPKLGQPMMFGPRPGGGQGTGTSGSKGGMVMKKEDRIWVLENGKPKAIVVKAGITDGQFTEVSGEGIQEGLEVLVGVETGQKQAGAPSGAPGGMGRR